MVDRVDRQASVPAGVSRSESNSPNVPSRRSSTRFAGSHSSFRRVSGSTAQALTSTSRPRSLFDSDGNITSLNIINPNLSPAASTRRHNRIGESDVNSPAKPSVLRTSASRSETPQRSTAVAGKQTAKKLDVAKSRTAPPELPMQRKKRRKEDPATSTEPVDPIPSSPGSKRRKPSPSEQKPPEQKKQPIVKAEGAEKRQPGTKSSKVRRGTSGPAKPLTPLELKRAEFIAEREKLLQTVVSRHDATVRELFFLEVHQNMLDYDPAKWKLNREDRLMQVGV